MYRQLEWSRGKAFPMYSLLTRYIAIITPNTNAVTVVVTGYHGISLDVPPAPLLYAKTAAQYNIIPTIR